MRSQAKSVANKAWQRFEDGSSEELTKFLLGLEPGRPTRIILKENWGAELAEIFQALPADIDLRFVSIRCNTLGDARLLALFTLSQIHLTKALALEHCGLTDLGLVQLLDTGCMNKLKQLYLCNRDGQKVGSPNLLGDRAALALANSSGLSQLEELDLWNTDVGDEGVLALVNSPNLAQLRSLTLWGTALTADGYAQVSRVAEPRHISLHTDFNRPQIWEW